jgi:ParB-like chromosome segregation protein Spo0J
MKARNRNLAVRRVKASSLVPHPQNWRTHPAAQRRALENLLAEVGFVGTLLAWELPDGRLQLLDGHLRRETLGEEEVDVTVVDLSPAEAAKVLATFDPLAAMAEADERQLAELLREVQSQSGAVNEMLEALAKETALAVREARGRAAPRLAESWQVLVDCANESEQRTIYERLAADGLRCRLLML